jgi:hypothetical protein
MKITFFALLLSIPFLAFVSGNKIPCNETVMEQVYFIEETDQIHTHSADTINTPTFGAYIYLSNYVNEECLYKLAVEYDHPAVQGYCFAALIYKSSFKVKPALDHLENSTDSVVVVDNQIAQKVALKDFVSKCAKSTSYIKTYGL